MNYNVFLESLSPQRIVVLKAFLDLSKRDQTIFESEVLETCRKTV